MGIRAVRNFELLQIFCKVWETYLALQKYDMDAYRRYLTMLSKAIQKAAETKDEETVFTLLQGVPEAERLLEQTKSETNSLAYRIRDIPDFEIGEEARDYIRKVKEILQESSK